MVLEILPRASREQLRKVSPKSIREELTGTLCPEPLTVVDGEWKHVPVDAERGEIIMLPTGAGEGCALLSLSHDRGGLSVYVASGVGETKLKVGSGEVGLRVSRRHYVGPLSNRYLPDPDEH
jgi:hypothetical protein